MRIAIYSTLNLGFGGGGERWVSRVASGLALRNHHVLVLTTTYGNAYDRANKESLERLGIDLLEFDVFGLKGPFKLPKLRYFKQIAKRLERFDVLYFNNSFALNEMFVYLIRRYSKIKVVSGNHGAFPETGSIPRRMYHRLINRRISMAFDAHHVLNIERENLMKSWGFRNVYRIPNGVDTQDFQQGQKRDIFTVMFAGRMTYQKGIDWFVRAVQYINDSPEADQDNMEFRIFGEGPLSRLPEMLEEKYRNVTYSRYVDRSELTEAYKSSHLFIFPSRFEEFGLVGLEAQAAGTPIIASNIPQLRELVTDGETGHIVNAERPVEMKNMILHFKNLWYSENRSHYQRYCSNCMRHAEKYDWKLILDRLEEMLTSVVQGEGHKASNKIPKATGNDN